MANQSDIGIQVPRSVRLRGEEAVGIYVESIRKGNKPSMAEMFACRTPAVLQGTDTQWLAGRGGLRKQFDDDDRYIRMVAERQKAMGHQVRENDVYLPTLAQYPGDPRAFVSSRGEAVKYAEEIGVGLDLDGKQVVKPREADEDPFESAPALCPQIAHEEAVKLQQSDPALSIQDATAIAVEKHGAKPF